MFAFRVPTWNIGIHSYLLKSAVHMLIQRNDSIEGATNHISTLYILARIVNHAQRLAHEFKDLQSGRPRPGSDSCG